MDPSRNLTQSIRQAPSLNSLKQKQICIWEWFHKYGPDKHLVLKLQINSGSMMTYFTADLVLLSLIQIEQNLRWMSPHQTKNTKRGWNQNLLQPKNGWYFNPPNLALQTQIESWPFYILLPFHWWRPIIPAFCSSKSLRRRGKPLGSPCAKNSSVIGYFWSKTDFEFIAQHFFQTLTYQTLVNRFFRKK